MHAYIKGRFIIFNWGKVIELASDHVVISDVRGMFEERMMHASYLYRNAKKSSSQQHSEQFADTPKCPSPAFARAFNRLVRLVAQNGCVGLQELKTTIACYVYVCA